MYEARPEEEAPQSTPGADLDQPHTSQYTDHSHTDIGVDQQKAWTDAAAAAAEAPFPLHRDRKRRRRSSTVGEGECRGRANDG